jgi:hypothetical protein
MQRKHQQLTPSPKSEHMIESREGAVMAQLRPIFYCRINLAMALTHEDRRIVATRLGMRGLLAPTTEILPAGSIRFNPTATRCRNNSPSTGKAHAR